MNYKLWTIKFFILLSVCIVGILVAIHLLKLEMYSVSDRMPNIRKVDKEYRLNVINEYLDFKIKQNKNYDIVIGDSQFYGFKQYEKNTFPYLIKKQLPNKNIINLSIVDGTEQDIIKLLMILQKKNVTVNKIIFNYNLSHFSSIKHENRLPDMEKILHTDLYLINLIESFWVDSLKKSLLKVQKTQDFLTQKYKKNRYNIVSTNNVNFENLLTLMSVLSDDVLIVFSPHNLESLEYSHYNLNEFTSRIQQYKILVNKYHLDILDLTFNFEKDDFLDILHLSIKGHIKISQIILDQYNRVN